MTLFYLLKSLNDNHFNKNFTIEIKKEKWIKNKINKKEEEEEEEKKIN